MACADRRGANRLGVPCLDRPSEPHAVTSRCIRPYQRYRGEVPDRRVGDWAVRSNPDGRGFLVCIPGCPGLKRPSAARGLRSVSRGHGAGRTDRHDRDGSFSLDREGRKSHGNRCQSHSDRSRSDPHLGRQRRVSGVDLQTVGIILMVVGAVGGLISLIFWSSWGGVPARDRRPRGRPRRRASLARTKSGSPDGSTEGGAPAARPSLRFSDARRSPDRRTSPLRAGDPARGARRARRAPSPDDIRRGRP